jgi:selenocysteine lyase/cysteine desulfurase
MALDVRTEFKIFKKFDFLDWANMSPAPSIAIKKIKEYLDYLSNFTEENSYVEFDEWSQKVNLLRQEVAKLLNAEEKEIAITGSSTTQGIQIAFEAISPKKGENIITSDLEFPLAGTELQKWKERGLSVKLLKHKNGNFDLNELDTLIDKKTKLVLLSSVTWVNGYRFDLEEVSKIVHEHDAYIVLDSVQHVGAMDLNVKTIKPDFIAAGGQKWLTAPFGIGILYVNNKAVKELHPPFYGHKNIAEPEEGWYEYFRDMSKHPIVNYKYVESAQKFEYGGTMPFPGIIGLKESVALINQIGIKNIESKILKLKKMLMEELEHMKAKILVSEHEKNYSGITTFNIKDHFKDDLKIVDHLNKNKILIAGRCANGIGGIRASIHYPNNESDVLNLIDRLKKLKL